VTREEYDGVVYDLDGTLVRLAVDWASARRSVAGVYREAGVDPDGMDLWDMLEAARDHGLYDAVESSIADHERAGASEAERLPSAGELSELRVPAAVCSLNSEAACRIALARHALDGYVDAVVGRDTLDVWKPDPRPLLTAIARIDRGPGSVVFVGDSERDAETARRAEVAFEYVGQ
jgi:phosphoglycolate phosphatase